MKGIRNNLGQKRRILKTCKACGKEFYAATKKRKYCSKSCIYQKQRRTCIHCGITFETYKRSGQKICSKSCPALSVSYKCLVCNKKVTRPRCFGVGKFCSGTCQNAYDYDFKQSSPRPGLHVHIDAHSKRRHRIISSGDYINKYDVYEFYDWTCIICNGKIDKALKWPDKMSASLDHIVPLCNGGTHTWDNVAPAHLLCNSIKGSSSI